MLGTLILAVTVTVYLTQKPQNPQKKATGKPLDISVPAQLSPIPPPKNIPASCNLLFSKIKNSFGSSCGSQTYDAVADLNQDRTVDTQDFSLSRGMTANETACKKALEVKNTPCL